MTTKVDFLLVGGGLASANAAETLRLEGADGTVAILSAEEYPPYQRPPLSTQFLLGTQTEDRLSIFEDSFSASIRSMAHLLVRAEWRHPSRRRKSTFGVKRTWRLNCEMSTIDPKRTSSGWICRDMPNVS